MPAPTTTDARVALLSELIDHAPMFPPAELPLAEALVDHAEALAGDAAWLVGRFVCRASRLAELPRDTPPRLSVVVDVPLEALAVTDERVEAVELPLPDRLDNLAPLAAEVYVEVPPDGDLRPVAAAGLRAKLRCGGARVPSIEELAGFIRTCRELSLVFKATAGLHHAVRTGDEHGFLNLLAAAVFGDEESALAEREASAFAVEPDALRWRDRRASAAEIAQVRRGLFVGFGSCSFTEPVDELRALGALPA